MKPPLSNGQSMSVQPNPAALMAAMVSHNPGMADLEVAQLLCGL
jgi:hypothetical protein